MLKIQQMLVQISEELTEVDKWRTGRDWMES